jgi:hypothetical protein
MEVGLSKSQRSLFQGGTKIKRSSKGKNGSKLGNR